MRGRQLGVARRTAADMDVIVMWKRVHGSVSDLTRTPLPVISASGRLNHTAASARRRVRGVP